MPYYESVFIARQDVSSSNVEELAGQFQQIVEEYGGRVTKTEHWGLRNLAYRIKKNRKGHYVMFNLDCPPEAVHELERNMRFNEDIIRYLTLRTETLDDNPSVMMERKERKDGRRGGGRGGRRRNE
ncbi:small subunit ribosomal protein S6 [Limimonas halophila]|uniref:Small ribosomal subunit protein bS6 n=1 Tax=Limimonas halophila TaxID=1082479 RepID=A0A1G7MEM3_9PROT|nr:30S ribosomal protein S6 [Limimonas halophila]SDF60141.1 small subunit ribosomal protein S6 [Limimonas halophila]